MMFEFFFEEYRKSIYKKNGRFRKNVPTSEKLLFAAFLGSLILGIAFLRVRRKTVSVVLFAVGIISAIILACLNHRNRDRSRDDYLEDHRSQMIQPLEDMLRDERYRLYSAQGIDWLIMCCKARIKEKEHPWPGLGDSFFKWIFPLITLALGAYLNKLIDLPLDVVVFTLFVAICIWLFGIEIKSYAREMSEGISWLLGLSRAALPSLLSDLEYIRTFWPEDEGGKEALAARSFSCSREGCPPCCGIGE